ncbi:TPA: hypothetical protein N0F65_007569 [Lagenidium giganteum]|uniref:Protein RFT1 homolog n=1 Tax=Lagenidium giganteum TaxID=4803 RepID=A0AAV2ZFZ3_9STRA|nr:TPA: hypothetical protein N0F65_007569 [Lagenidium giganteum]
MSASDGGGKAAPAQPSVLQKALRGGSYLFLQKILTFALNSFVLRKLQLSVTGAATVHCELALATIFLLRDGMRLGFLRVPSLDTSAQQAVKDEDSGDKNKKQSRGAYVQQLVNVAWLSTAVSWCIASVIALSISIWQPAAARSKDASDGLQDYTVVMCMYCVAAMIEALAEPMYVLAHCSVYVSWQVSAQGLGFLMRGFVQYVCIFLLDLGFLAHGCAEIAYATTLFVVFAVLFSTRIQEAHQNPTTAPFALHSMRDLLPGRPSTGPIFERQLMVIMFPLSVQSAVKYLLTEGDKWVLTFFSSFQNMGVYGIVFHLGSLVPRIVFLPIEEATKTIFSKMTTSSDGKGDPKATSTTEARRMVTILLKFMSLVGLVFVCFGTSYAHTLILLLYGVEKARLGVGRSLAMYCVYINFLGLNGICEAFVHAVGNEKQLMQLNKLMGFFFMAYCASAWFFMSVLQLGTVGIIMANCVNMGCRIAYCMSFMAQYFKEPHAVAFWRQSLPDRLVLAAFIGSFAVTQASQRVFLGEGNGESIQKNVLHVVVGSCCFAMTLLALYVKERGFLMNQVNKLRRPHQD